MTSGQELPGRHYLFGHDEAHQTRFARLYVGHRVVVKWSPHLAGRGRLSDEWLSKHMNMTAGKVHMIGQVKNSRMRVMILHPDRGKALTISLSCIYSITLIIPGYGSGK